MATSPNNLRVRLTCTTVREFRQKFPAGRTARAFVASDVTREIGLGVTVEFLFADGRVGAIGHGVVASKGRLGGRHGIVVQLSEITCSEVEEAPAPGTAPPAAKLAHSPIIDDLVEDRPSATPVPFPTGPSATARVSRVTPPRPMAAPEPPPTTPPPPSGDVLGESTPAPLDAGRPRRRWRWRWPVLAGAATLATAGFLIGLLLGKGTPRPPSAPPDPRTEQVRVALTAADGHIQSGRLVGPGADNALEQLLAARRLDPQNPEVTKRLELLSEKFEELAQQALRAGDLAEAAAHLQAALNATPERERLRQTMRDVEARMLAPPDAAH